MAQLIGGLATSHIPAIGKALAKGLQQEPYWKPFFDGFPPIQQWLGEVKPDLLVVFKLFWPEHEVAPVQIVPININTVQFPLPTAKRVYKLGQAVGRAIQSWDSDKKVMVLASGGLSHQLDGERAGHINTQFDQQFMQSMVSNPEWVTQFSDLQLVEKAGTQGVELLMWLAMRAALTTAGSGVRQVHSNYYLPISNTATGVMALETLE